MFIVYKFIYKFPMMLIWLSVLYYNYIILLLIVIILKSKSSTMIPETSKGSRLCRDAPLPCTNGNDLAIRKTEKCWEKSWGKWCLLSEILTYLWYLMINWVWAAFLRGKQIWKIQRSEMAGVSQSDQMMNQMISQIILLFQDWLLCPKLQVFNVTSGSINSNL